MRNAVLMAALVLGLATFVTAHVALASRILLHQRPFWRGFVAFFVPPLALVWGFQAGWKVNATVWLGAIALYVIALVVSLASG